MKISRRKLLLSSAASLLGSTANPLRLTAQAKDPRGGGGGRHITAVVFQNIGPSATPSESYVVFGQSFAKGDVPSGDTPVLKRADTGEILPAQFDLRNTWPDGSLRWCEISCVGPSIAANSTLQIDIAAAAGSYDNASVRNLSDITSNSDINIAISNCVDYTGATYMGGAQTLHFNAASAVNAEHIKSGPICDQWRVWGYFPGQPAGGEQLAGYFYVTAWTKQSDGTLATIQHIAKVHNGWLNKSNPTHYVYSCVYSDGLSLSRDFGSLPINDKPFSYSGAANTVTCTGHGIGMSDSVLVSGASIPVGMRPGTVYYAVYVDANTLKFATNFNFLGVGGKGGNVNFTSGSGTLQRRISHPNPTYWFCADTDAKPDWTTNEASIHVEHDIDYMRKSYMILPYDSSLRASVAQKPAYTAAYAPGRMSYNEVVNAWYPGDIGTAGAWPDRGWIHQYNIFSYLTQRAEWADTSRIIAAAWTSTPLHFLNEATGKIPALRGSSPTGDSGDYAGLGASLQTTWCLSGVAQNNVMPRAGGQGGWRNSNGWAWSHAPQPFYYVALTEGGAHWIDSQIIYANYVLMQGQSTAKPWNTWPGYRDNVALNTAGARVAQLAGQSNVSWDIFSMDGAGGNTRCLGWRFTAILQAASILPDSWIEQTYFKDIIDNNANFANDWIAAAPAVYQKSGFWCFTGAQYQYYNTWMQFFLPPVVAQAHKLFETSNLLSWAQFLSQHSRNIADGTWVTPIGLALQNMYVLGGVGVGYDHLLSWSEICAGAGTGLSDGVSCSTDSTTNVCTLTQAPLTFTLSAGTKILWPSTTGAGRQTPPDGIAADRLYTVINVTSATHFQISSDGVSPLRIGSNTSRLTVYWRPSTPRVPFWAPAADSSYAIGIAVLTVLKAYGFAVDTAYANAVADQNPSVNYAKAPDWAMQTTI